MRKNAATIKNESKRPDSESTHAALEKDEVVVTGTRPVSDWKDGLRVIDLSGELFGGDAYVYFTPEGPVIVAERIDELRRLRAQQQRYLSDAMYYRIRVAEAKLACMVDIAIANLAYLATLSRGNTKRTRQFFAGIGTLAVASAVVNCGLSGYDHS